MEKDEPDIRAAVAVPVEQRHGGIRLLRVLDRIRVAQVCKRRLCVVVIEKHRVFREYAQQKRNFLAVGRDEDAGIVDPAPCAPVRAGNVCRFRRLFRRCRAMTARKEDACERQKQRDWAAIKGRVKSNISGYLYKTTRRSPMVLPVIIEV